MNKNQKRHYEEMARISLTVAEFLRPLGVAANIVDAPCTELYVLEDFADWFAADNPSFNRKRFLEDCGLETAKETPHEAP